MNDKADVSASVDGDRRERFELVWAEHHARVLGYVLRRAVSVDDAADVVAEIFLVVWRRLDDAPARDTHLWLYGVGRRVLANHRRGERRRAQLGDRLRREWSQCEPIQPASGSLGELAAAFRSLSDADREVLALEGWEQLDVGEIATVLGCSRNAVRIRLHRARRRLHAALEQSHVQAVRLDAAGRLPDPILTNGEIT
jgi:RNA polymerase sigma-70 factor (ECF subfamily)